MTEAAPAPTLPLGTGRIDPGTPYRSASGGHTLGVEGGALVVRAASGEQTWALALGDAERARITHYVMQGDGNLVAQDAADKWVWSAFDVATDLEVGAQLDVDVTGVLRVLGPRVVRGEEVVRWAGNGLAWPRRRTLASPAVTVYGSSLVTPEAMDAVLRVYAEMTRRLTAAFPATKLDGYTVFVTNGEPWTTLVGLRPITQEFGDGSATGTGSADWVRGGTATDFLWVEEQMICKSGVVARNEGADAGRWTDRDEQYRTFDQVVHEMGHAIEKRMGMGDRVAATFGTGPGCHFAWATQAWFGTGVTADYLGEKPLALLTEVFGSEVFHSASRFEDHTGKVVAAAAV